MSNTPDTTQGETRNNMMRKIINEKSVLDPETGCINWVGPFHYKGYGVLHKENKSYKVHRVSFEVNKGPVPDGMLVCHSCDNRKCVNPDHLWIGTDYDNVRDMMVKGRNKPTRGEANPKAKLKNAQVLEIFTSFRDI